MAFDSTPTAWLAGWSEDGTDITVPIATFPELTAVEADATSGDIRKIMFAVIEKLFQEYNALDTADRPEKMTVSKYASLNSATDVTTNTYTIKFITDITAQEVADEA